MKHSLFHFFWSFVLFLNINVYAQTIVPRFESLGVNEGLSQNSVYSLFQDKKGFMWFGTADGLNRFDGDKIKVFKVRNGSESFNLNFVRGTLCEDQKGNIWFANETGLYYYNPLEEQIEVGYVFEGKIYYGVHSIIGIDSAGNLWLNTVEHLARFSPQTKKIDQFRFPFEVREGNIAVRNATMGDNLYFTVLEKNGLLRFNLHTLKFDWLFTDLKEPSIAGGDRKIFIYNTKTIRLYDSLSHDFHDLAIKTENGPLENIRCVLEDSFGRAWIGTLGHGICLYELKTGKAIIYRHDNARLNSLPIDLVSTMYVDRTNNLWIGMDGGGVARLDLKPPKFNLFPLNEGDYPFLSDYFTKCFYEDKKGRIWFGTHNSGVNLFSKADGTVENLNTSSRVKGPRPGKIVASIFEDSFHRIWIGHNEGLSVFDDTKWEFTTIPIEPKPSHNQWVNFVYSITETRNGHLLISSNQGLVTVDLSVKPLRGVFHSYDRWINLTITGVAEMSDHSIWYTSPVNGLFEAQIKEGKFRVVQKFLEGIDLRSLHPDELNDSILWVGSGRGLISFNIFTKGYKVFDEEAGLANSYVYGILEDNDHNLWVSTNGGLTVITRKSFHVQNYTARDGLQSNEFNTGAFYKGASGTLYFGGVKGFNWFRPGDHFEKPVKPGVAITSMLVNSSAFAKDSLFYATHTMVLPYNRNNLEFEFAALDFSKPRANKIHYKLDGWDKEWVTTSLRSVRYGNMPPGDYILRVKSSNSNGVWSDEENIYVMIQAPFWKTYWFYAFTSLLTLSLVVVVTKRVSQRKIMKKVRELEKQAAVVSERLRISKDMHDEIGSGLTHIALLSELNSTQPRTAVEMKNDIVTISGSAQKLVQSMGEIIWAINPQNDTLENLLAYLREQTYRYFEPFSIDYKISFPGEVPHIYLTNVQRRNLFLVTKEALNNALKHSRSSMITLSMSIEGNAVHFRVKDEGVGVDEDRIRRHSNGFKNMRSRMTELGGSVEVVSGLDCGTIIHYTMPLD